MGSIGDYDADLVDSIAVSQPAIAIAVYPCVGRGKPRPPLRSLRIPSNTDVVVVHPLNRPSSVDTRSVCSQDSGSDSSIRPRGRGRARRLKQFADKVSSQPGGLDNYSKTKSDQLAGIETQSDGPCRSRYAMRPRGPHQYNPWRKPQQPLFNMEKDFPQLSSSVESMATSSAVRKSQSDIGSLSNVRAKLGNDDGTGSERNVTPNLGEESRDRASEVLDDSRNTISEEILDFLRDRFEAAKSVTSSDNILDDLRDESKEVVVASISGQALDDSKDELEEMQDNKADSDVVNETMDKQNELQESTNVCEALDQLQDKSDEIKESSQVTVPDLTDNTSTTSAKCDNASETSIERNKSEDCEQPDNTQPTVITHPTKDSPSTSPQPQKSSKTKPTSTSEQNPECDLSHLIEACNNHNNSDDDDNVSEESEIVDPVFVVIDNLPAEVDWENFVDMLRSYGRLVSFTKSLQTNGTNRVSVELGRDSADMMVSCLDGSDILFEGFSLKVFIKELTE